ncbi:toll-like receptor 7 [Mytilus edulis]|uniref:toll-like receptor 7 n=1 Tax=Mytilus edulis TaxID=6550 RepID=UPI0039EF32B8
MQVKSFHRLDFYMTCDSPANMKKRKLFDIIKNSELDQLICNLSLADRCPPQCRCFYQPAIGNRTVVDCSGSGLTRFPSALPLYDHLQIDFTNNSIRNLKRIEQFGLNFFERIKKLDLSNNQIITISDIVLYRFRIIQLVNMRNNAIKRIPRSLQMLKPCQVAFGQLIMKCKCEDLWLKTWLPLQFQSCATNTQVLCEHNGLLRSITKMGKVDLGCPETNNNGSLLNISICSAFATVIIIASFIFNFRSEVFILTRSLFNFVKKPVAPNCIKHDIYISVNEDDPLVRKWLLTSLVPYLEGKGIDVFLFFRDSEFGAPREQETIEVMSKSRNFIILLSDITNGSQEWNKKEWKYAWNYYKCDFSRNLIVINYDFVKCDDTVNKFFRGFFTLRKVINFSNFDNKIEEDILTMLE